MQAYSETVYPDAQPRPNWCVLRPGGGPGSLATTTPLLSPPQQTLSATNNVLALECTHCGVGRGVKFSMSIEGSKTQSQNSEPQRTEFVRNVNVLGGGGIQVCLILVHTWQFVQSQTAVFWSVCKKCDCCIQGNIDTRQKGATVQI